MDLNQLTEIDPWEWPPESASEILAVLRDRSAPIEQRLLAAELGGEYVVINDQIADTLLATLSSREEVDALRSEAAISLGPVLEHAEMEGWDDPEEIRSVPISEATFERIRATLRKLYQDGDLSEELHQRILETAARAPQDWLVDEVRSAYTRDDDGWRHTAVFCMAHVPGFQKEIIEALGSEDPAIEYEAVRAAGNWEIPDAWPHIDRLLRDTNTEKDLRLIAIDAAAGNPDAGSILLDLSQSEDEDIAEAALDAIALAGTYYDDDEEHGDDDEPGDDKEE